MKEYAIEGTDGAGKTPVALEVVKRLKESDISVELFCLFAQVNEKIPTKELYPLWESDPHTAIKLLKEELVYIKEDARKRNVQVTIYDRHWMTVLTETMLRPHLANVWTDFVPTFFLLAPPEKTLQCRRYSPTVPWTKDKDTISEYYERYSALKNEFAEHILETYPIQDRTTPLEPIIKSIVTKISLDQKVNRNKKMNIDKKIDIIDMGQK